MDMTSIGRGGGPIRRITRGRRDRRASEPWWRAADRGSSTVAGVALVCAAAIMLVALACGGHILMRRSRARAAADLAALAGARSLLEGVDASGACAAARRAAAGNHADLTACEVDGEDVQVRVDVPTDVPLVVRVSALARAGPRACGASRAAASASRAQHADAGAASLDCGRRGRARGRAGCILVAVDASHRGKERTGTLWH